MDTEVFVPPLPGLDVKRWVGKRDGVRRFIRIAGINPGRRIAVHNNTLKNLVRGVAERVLYRRGKDGVFKVAPQPSDGVFNARLGGFRAQLLRRLPSTTPVALVDIPGMYRGRKQIVYQKAVDSLFVSPLNKEDAQVRVFVKYEKVDQTEKGDSAPRIISPRSTRYNATLGRYLKPSEKLLYRGIARVWGGTVVAKGMNMAEVGGLIADKWRKFKDPVAIGADAKRFDQHVSEQALKWEHSVYNGWFRSRELADLLRMQLVNNGVGYCPDGRVRYSIRGCRMSGDMNTSSGNCLLMCSMMHAYAQHVDVTTDLINNGDDCVIFMERRDIQRFMDGFQGWFLEMGFDMVLEEPVYDLEKVVFCQAQPIHVGNGVYTMVRAPIATMAKDSVALVPFTHKQCVSAWIRAVGDAGVAMYGGIPIMHSLYDMYVRSSVHVERLERQYDFWWYNTISRGMSRQGMEVLPETRLSFYIAFGVLPDEQIAIENLFEARTVNVSQPRLPVDIIPDVENEIKELLLRGLAEASKC
jgi:hypothetical protein